MGKDNTIPKLRFITLCFALFFFLAPLALAQAGRSPGTNGGQSGGKQSGSGDNSGGAKQSNAQGARPSQAPGKSGSTLQRAGGETSQDPHGSPEQERASEQEKARDAFREWLAHSRGMAVYRDHSRAFSYLMEPALDAGFPESVIRERIEEAAFKKVPADQALEALRRDAEDYRYLATLGSQAGWPPGRAAGAFYGEASSALRNGLGRSVIESVFSLAGIVVLDPRRAAAALSTLSAYQKAHKCTEEEAARFASALAASRLKAKDIPSILSLASRSAQRGLSPADFRLRVMEALRRAKSIKDIDTALTRP